MFESWFLVVGSWLPPGVEGFISKTMGHHTQETGSPLETQPAAGGLDAREGSGSPLETRPAAGGLGAREGSEPLCMGSSISWCIVRTSELEKVRRAGAIGLMCTDEEERPECFKVLDSHEIAAAGAGGLGDGGFGIISFEC